MLFELKVAGFLTIEEAHLTFDEGFIVFTGETGSGKSVLLKAIFLLLGERGGAHYLNPRFKEAEIEALIYGGEILAQRMEELGLKPEEEVHLRRIITPSRQRVYVNGSPLSLSELSALTSGLIEITSQHEFYSLFDRKNQFLLYDLLAEAKGIHQSYLKEYEKFKNFNEKIRELDNRLQQALRQRDFLEFQLHELEELAPNPAEEEELKRNRERLRNLTTIKEIGEKLLASLESAGPQIKQALTFLTKISNFEPQFRERTTSLENLFYELQEVEREVGSFLGELPEGTESLEEIETRLAKYEKLQRKYQRDTKGLLQLKEEIKKELSTLDLGEEELKKLKEEREEVLKRLFKLAEDLSRSRREKKPKLERILKKELENLGMKGAQLIFNFKVKSASPESLTSFGLDELEILFQANPGLHERPLEKVASGGELSRIYLILKSLLPISSQATLIFDEVDVGIGGTIAQKVGEKLKELSQKQQVICITHLPQIAKLADQHFLVEKHFTEGKTKTLIKKLTPEERLKELARMLGQPEDLQLAQKYLEE